MNERDVPDMASFLPLLTGCGCSVFDHRLLPTPFSALSSRCGAERVCKEGYNTLHIHITHYIIGLDVIGAGNQPGLHLRSWRCFGCSGKHSHIPWRDKSIGGTLDEEKWPWRNACDGVYGTHRIKVNTIK